MKRHPFVHIVLAGGQWYAFGFGERRARNLLLVPAINFCKRLNAARAKAKGSTP